MNKIKVLVTIKSNKIEAQKDSAFYKVDLNDSNKYTAQFHGTIIGNSLPRFGNSDKNELFKVIRSGDEEIIECLYSQFSEFIDGGSESDEIKGVELISGDLVDNSNPNKPIINTPTISQIQGLNETIQTINNNISNNSLELDNKVDYNDLTQIENSIENLQQNELKLGETSITAKRGDYQPTWDQVTNKPVILDQIDDLLDGKVDKVEGQGLSPEPFTTDEKVKLAALEEGKFQGYFDTLAELKTDAVSGSGHYAYVDTGIGLPMEQYAWSIPVEDWLIVEGEVTADEPSTVKVKYESNPDTNAFTDLEKTKLASITALFTTALKNAYDGAINWIATNGASLLNHLTNYNNPHNITKDQLNLDQVNNTSDVNKPVSIDQAASIATKQDKLVSGTNIKTVAGQSIMGSGDVSIPGLPSLISKTTDPGGFTISDYSDRIEYSVKIQTTNMVVGTGGNRYANFVSTQKLPDGVSMTNADWCEINVRNPSRTLDVSIYSSAAGNIVFGYFNNYNGTSSITVSVTLWMKLINYK